MGEPPRTLVIAAMREEVSALRRRAAFTRRLDGMQIAVTGEGAERAARAMSRLLEQLRPRAAVVIGFSGALSPDLPPGALLVGAEVRGPAASFHAGEASLRWAEARSGARRALVLTHGSIVTEPDEKARLGKSLVGKGLDLPAAVDLESATYVAAAVHAGVPWLVLRAISDTASETLPDVVAGCRDRDGSLRRDQLLSASLVRPRIWPRLWTLRSRARRCATVLADAVEALTRSRADRAC